MATTVYSLCALTSALCAVALIREYRRRRTRLLLWSSLSFTAFAVNNTLVFADLIVLPTVDLAAVRAGTSCLAALLLVVGLVWNMD